MSVPALRYLRYFILFTAILMFLAYYSLLTDPATIRSNYATSFQKDFTPLTARSLGAWFLLSGLVRLGAWLTWDNPAAGFQGWYDACLVSLVVPLWHYTLEAVVRGTVPVVGTQMVSVYVIDGVGAAWMWTTRKTALARH